MLIAGSYRRHHRGLWWIALPWRRTGLSTLLIAALAVLVSRGADIAVTGSSSTTAGHNAAGAAPRDVAVVLIPGTAPLLTTDFVAAGAIDPLDDDYRLKLDSVGERIDWLGALAARIVMAEGGPGRNARSSAAGYGQFLRGTWIDVFSRAYPELARKLSVEQILALRDVKPLAADLTRQYAIENAESLQRLGIRPTDAVLSLAHAVGSAGAANVMTAPPTQSVRDLLSRDAIIANPSFAAMTASDLQVWAATRLETDTAPLYVAGLAIERGSSTPKPAKDFRIEGGRMASDVLRANQSYIGGLRRLIEGPLSPGDGGHGRQGEKSVAMPAANERATEAVLEVVDDLSKRRGYERFNLLSKHIRQTGRIELNVLRDLALVLMNKMQEENATILRWASHRVG
jgi:hypothetical protein